MSSLDNYEIIPAVKSNIKHRNEVIPYYDAFYSSDLDAYSLAGASANNGCTNGICNQ